MHKTQNKVWGSFCPKENVRRFAYESNMSELPNKQQK
jgi:hypothetical protein